MFHFCTGKSFVIPNDIPSDIVPDSDAVSFLSVKGQSAFAFFVNNVIA